MSERARTKDKRQKTKRMRKKSYVHKKIECEDNSRLIDALQRSVFVGTRLAGKGMNATMGTIALIQPRT
jgi:hypothetical protein